MSESYPETYHAWQMAIKGAGITRPVQVQSMNPGTGFKSDAKIEVEEREAHTGTDTLDYGSVRVGTETTPEFEMEMLSKQGLEAYWYLLLGSYERTQVAGTTDCYEWRFFKDLANPKELPTATVINGYHRTMYDAKVYDDAMVNELEIKIVNNESPKLTVKLISDFPILRQPNPVRAFPTEEYMLKPKQTSVYLTPVGFDPNSPDLEKYKFDCFIEVSVNPKNNIEPSECQGDKIYEIRKKTGKFELESKAEVQWNEKIANLENEIITGHKTGIYASEESQFKQLIIKTVGRVIGNDGTSDVRLTQQIVLPKLEVASPETTESGDDTKKTSFEFKLASNGVVTPVDVKIISKLAELPISSDILTVVNTQALTISAVDNASPSTPVLGGSYTITEKTKPELSFNVTLTTDTPTKTIIVPYGEYSVTETITPTGYTSLTTIPDLVADSYDGNLQLKYTAQ